MPVGIYERELVATLNTTCFVSDLCLKWRILPFSASNLGKEFPEDWKCSSNPDPGHNRYTYQLLSFKHKSSVKV